MVLVPLSIAFFSIGTLIVGLTVRKALITKRYTEFLNSLAERFDVTDLDLSGETEYVRCVSHKWAIDNVSRRKYGKTSRMVQEFLSNNTLGGVIILGLITGLSSIFIGLAFIEGSGAFGAALGVFFVGAIVIMGPSDPKISAEFLEEIMEINPTQLNREDYVYVSLAVNNIKSWLRISAVIGTALIVLAPWADLIPIGLAIALSVIVTKLIFDPALTIASFNFPLAILYMALMGVILFFYIPKLVIRLLNRHSREETSSETMTQW